MSHKSETRLGEALPRFNAPCQLKVEAPQLRHQFDPAHLYLRVSASRLQLAGTKANVPANWCPLTVAS